MVLNTDKVLSDVLGMREDIQNNLDFTKNQYIQLYPYLYENVPTLFELVYKNEIDYLPMLECLLENALKVKNNVKSQYDIDVDVGQVLAEKYIHPNIDMEKEKNFKQEQ